MFSFERALGVLLSLSSLAAPLTAQSRPSNSAIQSRSKTALQLQRLPIAFEPSPAHLRGQSDYIVRSGLMFAEFSATETHLYLPSTKNRAERVAVSLEGADVASTSTVSERLPGVSNYILSDDPSTWRSKVAQFGRITYHELYPGIDLTYYGSGNQLEHDFIVHKGSSPSAIHMRFRGAHKLTLTEMGELQIGLNEQAIVLRRPRAYQTVSGDRREVAARFELAGNSVRFRIGQYDHSKPLIIDPVLDYSTFIGNASIYVTDVATDASGDVYITGEAPAAFGASTGAATCSSCVTATNKLAVYVTKLNSTGTAVLYSTFLGGSKDPYGSSSNDQSSLISVDGNSNAIISGWTSSTDFPTKNPIAAGIPSFQDGFLTSLSPDGSSLNFSSRIGGSSSGSSSAVTYPGALTIDSSSNVYLAGYTESPYLPVTPGALKNATPAYASGTAFLMRLSSQGSLSFSGIVGALGSASGGVGPSGVAVDGNGIIYLTGTAGATFSTPPTTPWPTTAGAYQGNLISPAQNAPFVTRVSADGSTILSSTLVGSGNSIGLTLTPTHDVIIAGGSGYNFPVTTDAYNSNVSTSVNGVISLGALGFVAKVSNDGTKLLYSSAFGPSGSSLTISGVAQDSHGNVWLAGTSSSAFSDLVHPLQSVFSNSFSGTGFVSEFDPSLHALLFESYISGTGFSQVKGLALDSSDHVHVAGIASMDFPTTANAFLGSVTPPPPNFTYNYGFAASIDASSPGPGICFTGFSGSTIQVGSSGQSSFNITNCGNAPLTVSGVQLTSPIFALTSPNNCVGTFTPGASCLVAATFTPTIAGPAVATVTIASNAAVPSYGISVNGYATAPSIMMVPSSITFPTEVFGASASGPTIVASAVNKGTAPLIVDPTKLAVTGDFSIASTDCGSPVRIPASSSLSYGCSIGLAFNPSALGTRTGILTVVSDDPVHPTVTVSVTGTSIAAYTTPAVTGLSIPSVALGKTGVSLTVRGSNFFPTSYVVIGGEPHPTTFGGSGVLTVVVDSSLLNVVGELPIYVVNPAPGGQSNSVPLLVYQAIPISSSALVYNSAKQMLYAAIPATATTNQNTVIAIDPGTGTMGTPIPVGNNPNKLAVSSDGAYLYVALYGDHSLQRINLSTSQIDRTFPLPQDASYGLTTVQDMHGVPGSPQSVVVSLARSASPSEAGTALFTDTGLVSFLGNTFQNRNYGVDSFAFTSNPSIFYGYAFSGNFFNETGVGPSALTIIAGAFGGSCCNQASGSLVASDGSLLYTNSGEVWDPATATLLGTYAIPSRTLFYEAGILPDTANKRTFILDNSIGYNGSSGYADILSFDQAAYTQAGTVSIGLQQYTSIGNLNRWGADGLAFNVSAGTPSDEIVILRSSTTHTGTGGTPSLSSLLPASAPIGSATSQITLNGGGFIPGTTVMWNGSALETNYVSPTQLTALVPGYEFASAGTAQITVANPAPGGSSSAISFSILSPIVTLSSSSVDFGSLKVGAASLLPLTVTNTGGGLLTGLAITIAGTNAASFSQTNSCGTSLAAGVSCTINLTFTPSAPGAMQASISLSDNAPASPQTVSLTGTAILSLSSLAFAAIPNHIFGDTPFTVSANSASSGAITYAISSGPATIAGATLTITGAGIVVVQANQAAAGGNAASIASTTFNVAQAKSPVSWTPQSALSLSYGSPVGTGVLNAGSTIAGSFGYTASLNSGPAIGITPATVLAAGSYTLIANFTPTDSVDYLSATTSVSLVVNKVTPTITWPAPAAITYGTALSAAQLDATASVPGTFGYSAAIGSVRGAGIQTISVTFTPTDANDYATASDSVSLTVNRAGLAISANNATRVYGTANSAFTGSVTGVVNGDTFTEAFSTTATAASNVGSYPIVPSVTGANSANYNITPTNGALTISQASTATTVALSNQNLTLTAIIASLTSGMPTGTVGFYEGQTLVGTGNLANGVASYTTASFPAGDVAVSAQYSGDVNFTQSGAPSISVLSVSPATTSLAVADTGSVTDVLSIAVVPGYSGTVTFVCTGLPQNSTCSFQPSSVAFMGTSTIAGVTMTIQTGTTASISVPSLMPFGNRRPGILAAALWMPGLIVVGAAGRRRRFSSLLQKVVVLLLLYSAASALTACGSSPSSSSSSTPTQTPAGASRVQVIASGPGGLSETTSVTLTVQ